MKERMYGLQYVFNMLFATIVFFVGVRDRRNCVISNSILVNDVTITAGTDESNAQMTDNSAKPIRESLSIFNLVLKAHRIVKAYIRYKSTFECMCVCVLWI